jgi:hypothetical protein
MFAIKHMLHWKLRTFCVHNHHPSSIIVDDGILTSIPLLVLPGITAAKKHRRQSPVE